MNKGVRLLKKYRFENELSQKEFAKKFNINRSTIASIECGINRPTVETAKLLGEILGINWCLFFEEE